MGNRQKIKKQLKAMVLAWQASEIACRPPVEFYSGRIMMYAFMQSHGLDAKRLHMIEKKDFEDFSTEQIITTLMD